MEVPDEKLIKEEYDAFVVLDFEAVWNDPANPVPEIIEFPSVILNRKTLGISYCLKQLDVAKFISSFFCLTSN